MGGGETFLKKGGSAPTLPLPQTHRRGAHPSISKDFYAYRIIVHSIPESGVLSRMEHISPNIPA